MLDDHHAHHPQLLRDTYRRLRVEGIRRTGISESDLLRTWQTLVDREGIPYTGEGLAVQIKLDQPGGAELAGLAHSIGRRFQEVAPSAPMYFPSMSSLHVTVFGFHRSTDEYKIALSDVDVRELRNIVGSHLPFRVTVEGLILVKGDLILTLMTEVDTLLDVRKQLGQRFERAPTPTDLLHITVARLLEPATVDDYKRYKDFVAQLDGRVNGHLEVLELSLVRHTDSMSIESARVSLPLDNRRGDAGTLAYSASSASKHRLPLVAVAVKGRDVDAVCRAVAQGTESDVVRAGERVPLSDRASPTTIVVFGIEEGTTGPVNASVQAIRTIQQYRQLNNLAPHDAAGVVLAGGTSSRNLGLAPSGNKVLTGMPGGNVLLHLAIDKLHALAPANYTGVLIGACDEVVMVDGPLPELEDRFTLIGGPLARDDSYLPTCGACQVDPNGRLVAFYEKFHLSRLELAFPGQDSIPVSWGLYHLPWSLVECFSGRFSAIRYGEFSRLVEAALAENSHEWLSTNRSYSSSFFSAAKEFLTCSLSEFRYVSVGDRSFFKHIGSNREYHEFCSSVFQSSHLRTLLGVSLDSTQTIVDSRAQLDPSLVLQAGCVVVGNCDLGSGLVRSNSVVVDCRIEHMEVGSGCLVAHVEESRLRVEDGYAAVGVQTSEGGRRTIHFPLSTDVKSNPDLFLLAEGQ